MYRLKVFLISSYNHLISTKQGIDHLDLALVALGSKVDVVLELEDGLGVLLLDGLEVDNEVVLDGEDGVGLDPGVVVGVELGGAALVVGVGDHDVNVGGAHGVAVHEGEELPRGAVAGEGVGGGVEAVEPVLALLVGAELATEVVGGLVLGVLEVVLAVGGGLPDVEDGAGDGLAGDDVADHTVHLGDAAVGGNAVLEDLTTELTEGSVGGPEGAENGGGGRVELALGDDLVGDLIDEGLEAENVADAVGLVAGLVGGVVDLAKGVDELDTLHPLVDGELDLTSKVVDVADQSTENLAVAGGGGGTHALNDILGEVGVETVSGLVGGHCEGCGWLVGW